LNIVGGLQRNEFSFGLDLSRVEFGVRENLTQKGDSLFNLFFFGGDGKRGGFAAHFHIEGSTQKLQFVF